MESTGAYMDNLLSFYKAHLRDNLLPFWMRALDRERGGVYTCFNNEGTTLVSTDKYTWSQGRFIWIASRIANLCKEGLLSEQELGDQADDLLGHAELTVRFLTDHVFMDNGNCAYLLTETGEKKESAPGEGYDASFYADCFVVLGFAEFARVSGDEAALELALRVYESIQARLNSGSVRSEPYPVPAGFASQSFAMIMLNVSQELAKALDSKKRHERVDIHQQSLFFMKQIMDYFVHEDDLLTELLSVDGSANDTLLARQIAPGHSIECMWFVMQEAQRLGMSETIEKAAKVVKKAFEIGWDRKYGGLYRYVDRDGGQPKGRKIGDGYEALICDTWDMKIWWPHSEALYTFLLSQDQTGDPEFMRMYREMHDYVFRTFPQKDSSIGEWIQIRDREGNPVQKVVALPVKDPYHIMRNVLLIIELLSGKEPVTAS